MVGRIRWYRRLIAPIALVISLFLMAAPTSFAAGADVYGVGGGSVSVGGEMKPITFAFSAHSGPTRDFGSFKWTQDDPFSPLELRADIDCVNVFSTPTGGAGWVQGPVKSVSPSPNPFGIEVGDQVMWYIADNGEPSDLTADEIAGAYFGLPPQYCKLLTGGGGFPITQGNINIKVS
jgi:hypothetical protein